MASVGVAASIAAAFNAPIAAVTFTLEEIVGNLDQTMLSGVIVAAAIAAVVERSVPGATSGIRHAASLHNGAAASSLISYAILGLLWALASVAFTDSLLGLRAYFKQFTLVPKWVHPAIGGALTGNPGGGGNVVAKTRWNHGRRRFAVQVRHSKFEWEFQPCSECVV